MPAVAALTILVATLAACDCGTQRGGTGGSQTAEADEPSNAPPPAEAPPGAPTPPPIPERPSMADFGAEAVAVRRARVAEARAAASRGDMEAAAAAFDALLETKDGSPRVLCEAGVVHHRAGNTERAADLLDRGLSGYGTLRARPGGLRASLRRPYAMCIYNRGLVHEAAGEEADAHRRYREYLGRLPENRESGDEASQAPEGERALHWRIVRSWEAAVSETRRVWCAEVEENPGDDTCHAQLHGDLIEGDGRSFAIVAASTTASWAATMWSHHLFVLEEDRFRHVAEIATAADTGGFTRVSSSLGRAEAVQLVPSGPSGFRWTFSFDEVDTEHGGYYTTGAETEGFCFDYEGEFRCRAYDVDRFDSEYDSHEEYPDAPVEEERERGPRGRIEFLPGERIRVTGSLCLPPGTYSFSDLFTSTECGAL